VASANAQHGSIVTNSSHDASSAGGLPADAGD
jgi:hypothetical protein